MAKQFKSSLTLKQYSQKFGTKVNAEGETVPLEQEDLKVAYDDFVAKEKEKFEEDAIENAEGDTKHSYPPNPRKDRDTKILRGKWRDQKRVKCAHPKCCYPLNVRMEKGQRYKIEVPAEHEHEGEVAYEAECSWDPRHMRPEDGTKQYVTHKQLFPPDDVSDEDLE